MVRYGSIIKISINVFPSLMEIFSRRAMSTFISEAHLIGMPVERSGYLSILPDCARLLLPLQQRMTFIYGPFGSEEHERHGVSFRMR